jgi:hypothetical protein
MNNQIRAFTRTKNRLHDDFNDKLQKFGFDMLFATASSLQQRGRPDFASPTQIYMDDYMWRAWEEAYDALERYDQVSRGLSKLWAREAAALEPLPF